MKKILSIGTLSLISTFALANSPAILQSGEPLPAGAQIDAPQNLGSKSNVSVPVSVAAGYAGSKVGSSDLGGDERFNGFFINVSVPVYSKTNFYTEYEYQDASDMDFNEFSAGMQYNVLENDKTYLTAGLGLGYAWMDESAEGYSLELGYLTVPLHFELGYKIQPNIDVFGNLGYKWFINQKGEACIYGVCAEGSSSDLNIDGMTYKAGLRYTF